MSGYRPAYTLEEQRTILNFIIEHKKFYELRGVSCWKELAETDQTNRTWQSLKEHFLKKIYPKLHYQSFGLTAEQINLIRTGFEETSMSKFKSNQNSNERKEVDLQNICDSSDDD